MIVKKPFKAALAYNGIKLHEFCAMVKASHTQVYRILNAMEEDPKSIPDTVEAARIVGAINDLTTKVQVHD